MILRNGTRKNYRIWFLSTLGISSCGISQGEIISVNCLLCYRFFIKWLLLKKLKLRGWLIEVSGVQNCFQNFDSNPQAGEINVFVFFPMLYRINLYLLHVPLCELEFPFTIKKSICDLDVPLYVISRISSVIDGE